MKSRTKRSIGQLALVFLLSFLLVFGTVLNVFGTNEGYSKEEVESTVVESQVNEDLSEEGPTNDESTDENPVKEDLSEEDPANDELTDENPVKEDPSEEGPTNDESTDENPVKEDPSEEDPANDELTDENPVKEDPLEEDPIDEDIELIGVMGGIETQSILAPNPKIAFSITSNIAPLSVGDEYEIRIHVTNQGNWHRRKLENATLKLYAAGEITTFNLGKIEIETGDTWSKTIKGIEALAPQDGDTVQVTAELNGDLYYRRGFWFLLEENHMVFSNYSYTVIPATYPVTFTVIDGTDQINEAEVTIDSETKSTDSNGQVTFNLPNGDYIYGVSAEGFEDISEEELMVSGEAQEVTVIMVPIVDEGNKVYLHEPHKNSNSKTGLHGDGGKISRKDNDRGGLEDPVVWHLVLNQARVATGPVKVVAQFEKAGPITILGSPTGTNMTQHFFIGLPDHDVLLDAVAYTSEGSLVLSHIALNEPEDPPGLTIVKTSKTTTAKVGDVVTYTITVVNNFNKTLSNVKVTDNELGRRWDVGTLKKNQQWRRTIEYTLTEENEGVFVNTAKVTGKLSNKKITASDSHEIEVIKEDDEDLTVTLVIEKIVDGTPTGTPEYEITLEKIKNDDLIPMKAVANVSESTTPIKFNIEEGENQFTLPVGWYRLYESKTGGATVTYDKEAAEYVEILITYGDTTTVTITNTFEPGEIQENISLEFQKLLLDGSEEDDSEFTIWVNPIERPVEITLERNGIVILNEEDLKYGKYWFYEEEIDEYKFESFSIAGHIIGIDDITGELAIVLEKDEDGVWRVIFTTINGETEEVVIEGDTLLITVTNRKVTSGGDDDDDPITPPGDGDDDDDDDPTTPPGSGGTGGGGGGTITPPTMIEVNDEEIPLGTLEIEVKEEELPLGTVEILIEEVETPLGAPEVEPSDVEIVVLDEEVPLGAPQLPKTGESNPLNFYFLGLLLAAIGVTIRKVF